MDDRASEATALPVGRLSIVLREGTRRLRASGIDSAALDAEVLLSHILNLKREQLVLAAQTTLSHAQRRAYEQLLERRSHREPVAYITAAREFWSLDFYLTPAVLIPRPETERLVEVVLDLAHELASPQPLRILDIGTGSGAIAVALASELTSAEIWATDISPEALAVAAENAARNHVAHKIEFIQADLFAGCWSDRAVDLLVSNPPYIRRGDIETLEPEVSRWEPRCALDGGVDGLDYYRRIAAEAFEALRPGGAVAVEIGAGMGPAVAGLFSAQFGCAGVEIYDDYAGNERVVVARKKIPAECCD